MPSDSIISWGSSHIVYKGGYSIGIGTFAGINFNLNKYFAIGAAFSSSLLYYKVGGEYYGNRTYQNVPNPPITEVTTMSSNSFKGFKFAKIQSTFNISFLF